MKKLLAILAAVGISITGASSAIACDKDSTVECPPCDSTPERTNLRYLLDYAQTTIDELDPVILPCVIDERLQLANDIIKGSLYLVELDVPISKIKELNIKILADHKVLWLKITQCSVERNNKPTTN